ncbi:hypothetical protein GCM10010412_072920 [Nonomuraea recticatena]
MLRRVAGGERFGRSGADLVPDGVAQQNEGMRPWVKIVCAVLIVAMAGSALVSAANLLMGAF